MAGRHQHEHHDHARESSLNRLALGETIHCLTGCTIGEVLGMVIGTALGLGNRPTVALAIAPAFLSGYLLTMIPLLRSGLAAPLFWASLVLSLAIAGAAAYPVVRWLIARGRGHAVLHGHH